MNAQSNFRINHRTWLLALISAAYSTSGFAAAGKVEFSLGDVSALSTDGRERSLNKGAEIGVGDTIKTKSGRAQVRFNDGGYISLQPNTEFKVDDYNFNGKADGSEKSFFSLVKGGLRAITGVIGHGNNKTAYRVNTPVATIGIRGTEYLAQFDTKLLVKVGGGAVYLENQGGDLVLYKGQIGEVSGSGSKPQHTDEEPSVTAAGPAKGNPVAVKEDAEQSKDNRQVFITGDLKTALGAPCDDSNSGDCGFKNARGSEQETGLSVSAQIAQYNSTNSIGTYTNTSAINVDEAGTNYTGNAQTILTVYFGSYSASSSISAPAGSFSTNPSLTISGAAGSSSNGVLNSSNGAIFPFSGAYSASGGTSACSSGCSGIYSISSGSVSGASLNTANMTYSLGGTLSSGPNSIILNGTVTP